MVRLRAMTEEEFRAFREYSVADYALDLEKGQGLSPEKALEEAEREFDADLPDGLATEFSFLMNIEDGNGHGVGWIFYKYYAQKDGRTEAFLADLLIFRPERRKGYASAAIREMNARAKKDGCAISGLFVWDHNPAGKRLYEKCGYRPRGREEGGTYMAMDL